VKTKHRQDEKMSFLPMQYVRVTIMIILGIICCAVLAATIIPTANKPFVPREGGFVITKYCQVLQVPKNDRLLNQICLQIQRLFHLRQLFAVDVAIISSPKMLDAKYILYTSVLALQDSIIKDENNVVILKEGDLALFYSADTAYEVSQGRCYIITWRLTEKKQRIVRLGKPSKRRAPKWKVIRGTSKNTFRPLQAAFEKIDKNPKKDA
jgi:hypothetical protein